MSRYGGYYGFAPYESVSEKKAKAKKKIAQMRKQNKDISPVEIEGRAIAKNWWGKAWNHNLEVYADFSNRLSRGRSYVTHGCVLDLKINKGTIIASVMGSGKSVYQCVIRIDPLKASKWERIKTMVAGEIASLPELLAGEFPKKLESAISAKDEGLFPAPSEFHPDCDCPDGAKFCKHLAAVIYGVGNRLDTSPELLFTLRGIDSKELISQVVTTQKDNLLAKFANVKSKRRMRLKNKKLSQLFGVEFSMPAGRK
ncbi:MAG: hypothetical protein GXP32_02445 [Kiritimatiellaeota bacterium]|nr:hypothetical protein [Kiritimatiellota bacterium]